MPTLRSILAKVLGAGARLAAVEKMVLACVRDKLDPQVAKLWDDQISAINKVQRLPEGAEVNFYRMKHGHPSFDEYLAFPNRAAELLVAQVKLELVNEQETLIAKVWCVKGFVFSIEYSGSVSYFEEAAGMDPRPEFRVSCELLAALQAA